MELLVQEDKMVAKCMFYLIKSQETPYLFNLETYGSLLSCLCRAMPRSPQGTLNPK